MPSGTTSIRVNLAVAYAIAYVFVLYSCIRIWFADASLLYIGRDADFSIWLAKKLPGLGASVGGYRIKSVSGDGQHAHPMRIRISIQRLDLPDRARFREQARFVHGSVFC